MQFTGSEGEKNSHAGVDDDEEVPGMIKYSNDPSKEETFLMTAIENCYQFQ